MAGTFCIHCGGNNPPGAVYCQYCGSAMPGAGSTPLSQGPAAPLSSAGGWNPPPGATYPYAPPPPRRHRLLMVVVIVVVVLVVISVVAYYLLVSSAPAVQVGYINIWAPDNVCGLNSNPIAFYGFNSSTGASQTFDFDMANFNATPCTIHSVVTNTSGFTLSAIQVPLTIPGSDQNASMNMTITSPGSSFNGNLNLVLT